MPAYHKQQLSLDNAQDYLSHINPLAWRIARDIQETRETMATNYGQLWNTLTTSEQNDIINETLIKPELSLKYFDSSLSSSTSSVFNDNSTTTESSAALSHLPKKNPIFSSMKNYYAFDGRNLKTFAMQKVAIKCIHDNSVGTYRDEFSAPFSCRTRSQINLELFGEETKLNLNANLKLCVTKGNEENNGKDNNKNMNGIHKRNEINTIVNNHHKTNTKIKVNYERLENDEKEASHSTVTTITKKNPLSITTQAKNSKADKSANKENDKSSLLRSYNSITTPSMTYADAYCVEHEESASLIQNCCSGSILTGYSSSADDDDDDEKTLCEDVKLLDNDLRKGFDFLNNW